MPPLSCGSSEHQDQILRRSGEMEMAQKLLSWYEKGLLSCKPEWDKRNPQADPVQCGAYRPDFAFAHDTGVTILEYDPVCHKGYNKRCELVRQYAVSFGYGGRPVHWIRFNPSFFFVNGKGNLNSETRDAMLLEHLQTALCNPDFDHPIKVDYLFYRPVFGGTGDMIQSFKFASFNDYCDWVEQVAPDKNAMKAAEQTYMENPLCSSSGRRASCASSTCGPVVSASCENPSESSTTLGNSMAKEIARQREISIILVRGLTDTTDKLSEKNAQLLAVSEENLKLKLQVASMEHEKATDTAGKTINELTAEVQTLKEKLKELGDPSSDIRDLAFQKYLLMKELADAKKVIESKDVELAKKTRDIKESNERYVTLLGMFEKYMDQNKRHFNDTRDQLQSALRALEVEDKQRQAELSAAEVEVVVLGSQKDALPVNVAASMEKISSILAENASSSAGSSSASAHGN